MIKNQWGNEENTKLDPPGRVFLNLCITLPLGSQTNAAVEPNRSTEPNPQPTTLLLVHPPYFSPYFPPYSSPLRVPRCQADEERFAWRLTRSIPGLAP